MPIGVVRERLVGRSLVIIAIVIVAIGIARIFESSGIDYWSPRDWILNNRRQVKR